MAKKKEMDNLAKDAAAALAAGMSYGMWKAIHGDTKVELEEDFSGDAIPEGWKICRHCGKLFKPNKYSGRQFYCDIECQRERQRIRERDRKRKQAEKKRAEAAK